MDSSSSSKVTVEYHDPSGVFTLIQNDLTSRLPLRNLNWKSPTRPLRQIDALHVEFTPSHVSAEVTPKPIETERPKSLWISKRVSTPVGGEINQRERRHQIPGLRQTPYLKLFLLRCDDKDAYKTDTRKQVRDWLRDNTPSVQSTPAVNKSGQHDTFDWMIIHVVIPDTVAASEPRWRPDKKDPDELAERSQSKAKWPTKSPSTVYDKIRADFNPSGKNALERVAQIRLQKNDVPPQFLPKVPVASPYSESPQEQENAWQDLIGKFKILILQSFDLRVSQYEEDIREKESQRALPGWNFCTFFTLKEGLARGFESVGLVEDALSIYEELSAGLDASMRVSDGSATFLGDLAPLKRELEHFVESRHGEAQAKDAAGRVSHLLETPLELSKKDYRGQIVSSTISLFDFQTYIFARQRELLYRLGSFVIGTGPDAITQQEKKKAQSDDDLVFVADVCKRAAAFVTSNSRVLRNELSAGSSNIVSFDSTTLIDQAASSWAYSVIDQILTETASPALASPASSTGIQDLKQGSSFNFPQGANTYPLRRSSLNPKPRAHQPKSKVIYENEKYALAGGSAGTQPAAPGSGLADLAAGRGELFLMQRRILEALAAKRHWLAGWAAIEADKPISLVNLDNDSAAPTAQVSEDEFHEHLLCDALGSALNSAEGFRESFEALNDLAVRHFILGNRTKSAESLLGDHALLKFQSGDYASAAQYFSRVVPKYLTNRWSYIQAEMLRVYARCLKELHRRDDFMRVTLSLLTKVVDRRRAKDLPSFGLPGSSSWMDEDSVDVQGSLAELIDLSAELPYNFSATLEDYFGDLTISTEVIHYNHKDGFQISLKFRHLLDEHATLDRVRLRLVNADESGQEIWVESDGPIQLTPGEIRLMLHSHMSTHGLFLIDRLVLEAEKLHFVQDLQHKSQQPPLGLAGVNKPDQRSPTSGPCIMLYPRSGSLNARVFLCPTIHIDKQRSLRIEIETGTTSIDSLDARIKPASAGLRLYTAGITMISGDVEKPDLDTAGTIKFAHCGADQKLTFQVPYSLENDLTEITVRLEVSYVRDESTSIFQHTAKVSTQLSLDVDVNDHFTSEALFSRFSVRTTNTFPLVMGSVDLQPSSIFAVDSMPCPPNLPIFEAQPACLAYRITRQSDHADKVVAKADAALTLNVTYCGVDDVLLNRSVVSFAADLTSSTFSALDRLLVPAFRDGIVRQMSTQELEEATLLDRISVYPYDSMNWEAMVCGLPTKLREDITTWLRAWHDNNTTIALQLETPPESCQRLITISVDVPTIDIVHTATLDLNNTTRASAHMPPLAIAGQPIFARLRLRYTRAWSATRLLGQTESSSDKSQSDSQSVRDFVCTIQEVPEIWLIGGSKRMTFTAQEDEEITFDIMLIPLVPGTHTLPLIDIEPVLGTVEASDNAENGVAQASLSCETDYRSAAQTVMVTQDSRRASTTVMDGIMERTDLVRASTDTRMSKVIA